jgi:hypothetical protein
MYRFFLEKKLKASDVERAIVTARVVLFMSFVMSPKIRYCVRESIVR